MKPNSREKGTLNMKGLLRNLDKLCHRMLHLTVL